MQKNIQTEQATSAATSQTVDGEGLINNYAIEPEMYVEDGSPLSPTQSMLTVVDIFPTEADAKNAVLEMQKKGLQSSHIAIAAKDYSDGAVSDRDWKEIIAEGKLAEVLADLGIEDCAISQFVDAVNQDKFLVIEIGSDREASQAVHVLENIGHSIQAD
jgi:hypothetical protein